MNILLVEDRGSAVGYIHELLSQERHRVTQAYNPNDAQDAWNKRTNTPVHCIILDLNLPQDGLTPREKDLSRGGLLSGWNWLSGHVLKDSPQMKERVIIYSDYIRDLEERVKPDEYGVVPRIPKRQRVSAAKEVLDHVRRIADIVKEI